ncbi:MauE/DoxX family redox-associated membrane protein [Exiguobacterium sp. s57]|uniref:MauE/DoxX family redox-associated membrane protein n=1 Tax=Exiguobacterium sp. s57 TaxID=2751258 RepID=UPI00352C53F1
MVVHGISILIGLYFLKNSVGKTRKIFDFYIALEEYSIVSETKILVSFLVSLEVMLALSLISNLNLLFSIVVCTLLHGTYIWMLFVNLGKSHQKNCGCFGSNVPPKPSLVHFAYNLSMCILVILLYAIEVRM